MDRDSLSHHDFEIIYIWFVKISSVIVDKKKLHTPIPVWLFYCLNSIMFQICSGFHKPEQLDQEKKVVE